VETFQALDDLVHQGKVRYVGHSNFAAWQIVDAQWIARTEHLARPISAQHQYSLLHRDIEKDVVPAVRAMGLGLLPYFPLAGGFLTGKYRRDAIPEGARLSNSASPMAARLLTDQNWRRIERLEAFADERGHSLIELAFGWLLAEPSVMSVIAGATKPDQVDTNVAAGLAWHLTPEELQAVPTLEN